MFSSKAIAGPFARTYQVTIGVQAAVFDAEGRVLLVRHGYRDGWHFPGGGVERGETLRQALDRELEEETGVIIAAEPKLLAIYAHFDEFPGDHIALFLVRNWSQPRFPPPNHEIRAQQLFARAALPAGTSKPTQRRLREIVEGAERSENW